MFVKQSLHVFFKEAKAKASIKDKARKRHSQLRNCLRKDSKSRILRSVNSHTERKRSRHHRIEQNLNRGARKFPSQRFSKPTDGQKYSAASKSSDLRPSIPYYRDLNREKDRLQQKYGISLLERYPKVMKTRICRTEDRSQAGRTSGESAKEETVSLNRPVSLNDLCIYI